MAGLLRVTPPCEPLVDPKPQWQQTYVVLGDHKAEAAFKAFAHAQAVNGAGMWAIHQTRNETYLVITLGKAGCEKGKIREIKEGLYMLPGTGGIEWVRPFTRRFQCLFGWDATVEEACERNDTKKLSLFYSERLKSRRQISSHSTSSDSLPAVFSAVVVA